MFDWYQYLVLAEYLYDNRDTFYDREACLRAAISKAYYSAFCSARNYARDFDRLILDESAQDHGSVKKHYIRAPDPKNRQVGNFLDRLRDLRNQADYLDSILQGRGSANDKLEDLSKAAISQSKQVHTLLKQIYRS